MKATEKEYSTYKAKAIDAQKRYYEEEREDAQNRIMKAQIEAQEQSKLERERFQQWVRDQSDKHRRAIKVKYLAPTTCRGARVSLTDTRHAKRIAIAYNYSFDHVLHMALHHLETIGIEVDSWSYDGDVILTEDFETPLAHTREETEAYYEKMKVFKKTKKVKMASYKTRQARRNRS